MQRKGFAINNVSMRPAAATAVNATYTVEGSILIQKSADKQLFPKIYPLFGEKLQITIVVPLSFFIFVKENNPF